MIAGLFHRMKYMERLGSGLRKIDWEIEKLSGYIAAYNPEIFSTATDFRVILKNANYQLSQKNLVNDQVSEQDKSSDILHAVLNFLSTLLPTAVRVLKSLMLTLSWVQPMISPMTQPMIQPMIT